MKQRVEKKRKIAESVWVHNVVTVLTGKVAGQRAPYFLVRSRFPHFRTLPVLSPLSSSTSPLSHFTPSIPFLKEVNKKLSYRGHNALSVIITRKRNTDSEHIVYLSVPQSILTGGIMYSTCPFVRPSVCPSVTSFVCYHLVNATLRKRMNRFQCKLAQIFLCGKGMNGRPRGPGGRSHKRHVWKPGGEIILDPLSRVDRGMQ